MAPAAYHSPKSFFDYLVMEQRSKGLDPFGRPFLKDNGSFQSYCFAFRYRTRNETFPRLNLPFNSPVKEVGEWFPTKSGRQLR